MHIRTRRRTPERAEDKEEKPEHHRVSVITDPYDRKSDIPFLLVERIQGDSRQSRYHAQFPLEVGDKGLWTGTGDIHFNHPNEAEGHAESLLREAGIIFVAAASRLGRTINHTEYAQAPHGADLLKRLQYEHRENVQAGGDYLRKYGPSEGHGPLRPDQEKTVQAIVEFVKKSQSRHWPKR